MRKSNQNCVNELMEKAKISKEKGAKLSVTFGEIAKKYNMTAKSVRNLYYKTLKTNQNNPVFLGLAPKQVKPFKTGEDSWLVREILTRVKDGKSVRRAVMDIANYDTELALRYQNKYRNIKSKDKTLIFDVAKSINLAIETDKNNLKKDFTPYIRVVSKEIDELYERIKQSYIKKEKELLQENEKLKKENEMLNLKLQLFKSQFLVTDKNIV